jgi:hypothetical protein
MHFEEEESAKRLEPDIFSFGVTLYSLATNGLTPWHPSMALCNFDDILQSCGRNGSCLADFIDLQQNQQTSEQKHDILDEQTGCVFISGRWVEKHRPSASVITQLAWQCGSPNTAVG